MGQHHRHGEQGKGDKRSDDERLQVLWQESLPEILAEREQEHCNGDGHNVALEPE